jgi:ribosomal protein S27E
MTDERIVCTKCGKKTVPRLWHRWSVFTKKTTEHICPYCGEVMYQTGGGLSILSKGIVIVFAVIILGSILRDPNDNKVRSLENEIRFSQGQVDKYSEEIRALEESIKKQSTPYLVDRVNSFRKRRAKFQTQIDEFQKELEAIKSMDE